LDQPLIKSAIRPVIFGPQVFPDFVALEKLALIEVFDPLQIARIVLSVSAEFMVVDRSRWEGVSQIPP